MKGSRSVWMSTLKGSGSERFTPRGAPTSASLENAVRRVDREDDGPEPAHRVRGDVCRRQPESVEDVPEERAGDREHVCGRVVEGVSQSVARHVDREDPVVPGELRKDRHPHAGVAHRAVDEEQRGPCPEFKHLGLSLRPRQSADTRVGRISREQRRLRRHELTVKFRTPVEPRPGVGPCL